MSKRTRKQIEPTAEDLSNVEFETSEEVDVVHTFDSMGLGEELLRGIYSYGWFLFRKKRINERNGLILFSSINRNVLVYLMIWTERFSHNQFTMVAFT